MVPYCLNMARGFVMPLEVRNKWLHWFMAYILICCALITVLLYRVIETSSRWHAKRDVLARQEARVLDANPGYKTLAEYKGVIEGRVMGSLKETDALVGFERGKSRVARILLGLAEPLPDGVELGTVEYDAEGRKVHFEVVMPVSQKMDDKLAPTHMVAVWEREPLLVGSLAQIEVENSERVRRDGVEMMCRRFTASLGEK